MPIILHRLAWRWGYLQLVVGTLKTALITAYLAAKVDARAGYLLCK